MLKKIELEISRIPFVVSTLERKKRKSLGACELSDICASMLTRSIDSDLLASCISTNKGALAVSRMASRSSLLSVIAQENKENKSVISLHISPPMDKKINQLSSLFSLSKKEMLSILLLMEVARHG